MSRTYKTSAFMLLVVLNYMFLSFAFPTFVAAVPMSALSVLIYNQVFLFAVPIFLYFFITKDNIKTTLSLNPLGLKNAFLIVVIALTIQPVMLILSLISTLLFPNTIVDIMYNQTFSTLIIGMSVVPAFFEEIVFRGIVYGNLKQSQPFLRSAILAGLFFGIIHFSGQQFLYAFLSGILFCLLVKKTNSIFSSMLAHFTINASQGVMVMIEGMYAAQNGISLESQGISTFADIAKVAPILILMIAIAVPFMIMAFKRLKPIVPEKNDDYVTTSGEPFINIPFVLILIIYIGYILITLFN